MKKGISLIILVITSIILLALTSIVVKKGLDIEEDVEYIRFEKIIQMIEKAITKANLKNKIYGTKASEYSTDVSSIIDEINNKYGISLTLDNCYVINKQDLKNMGISNVSGEFIIYYEKNYVFSLNGLNNQGEKIYTTMSITEDVNNVINTTLEDLNGEILINIVSDTQIKEVKYLHNYKEAINKQDFYNENINTNKAIMIEENVQGKTYNYKIDKTLHSGYGIFGILLTDINDQTRFFTIGEAIKDPIISLETSENMYKFNIKIQNLYGYEGTLYYKCNDYLTSQIVNTSHATGDITIQIDKLNASNGYAGNHELYLIRNDMGFGETQSNHINSSIPTYPDPTINVVVDYENNKFKVTANNLEYYGGKGGKLYLNDNLIEQTSNNTMYKEVNSSFTVGTYNFRIVRNDNKSANSSKTFQDLTVDAQYNVNDNLVTVTINNLYGFNPKIEYTPVSLGSTITQNLGTAHYQSVGRYIYTFNPQYVPADYNIKVSCDNINGGTISKQKNLTLLPIVTINMYREKNGLIYDRSVLVKSTPILGNDRTINKKTSIYIIESEATFTNNGLTAEYNYVSASHKNKDITITITANGYTMVIVYRMRNEESGENISSNGYYKIETFSNWTK